ncbi:MAG: hypothetical protein FJ363_12335 [Gemmatimonadetes bacterium]|nr:hypothetical protein [Gemmatimonadota bacterium]
MQTSRITTLALVVLLAAACGGEKVQPESENTAAMLSPEARQAKEVEEYQKRQAAFADSVLGNAATAADVAKSYKGNVQVGSVAMRDSIAKFVGGVPECFKGARDTDPYVAGTATFYVHMSVVGSDVIRVQNGEWTSQAGQIAEKCLNEKATTWKLPMGLAKPGQYLVQVQFK